MTASASGEGTAHPKVAALSPHGRALRAWHEGQRDAEVVLHSSLGEHEALPAGFFFRGPEEFFPAERYALDLCRGRVLDLGAGTGLHALVLQERGIPVVGLEIEPRIARIARERGVSAVVRADFFRLPFGAAAFDTALALMNGVGPVGTLERLPLFLEEVGRVLSPGGQLLLDSGAPVVARGAEVHAEGWPDPTPDRYPGEAWIRLEFEGEAGPPFRELYIDADALARRCAAAEWSCQIAYEEGGAYLARLRPL